MAEQGSNAAIEGKTKDVRDNARPGQARAGGGRERQGGGQRRKSPSGRQVEGSFFRAGLGWAALSPSSFNTPRWAASHPAPPLPALPERVCEGRAGRGGRLPGDGSCGGAGLAANVAALLHRHRSGLGLLMRSPIFHESVASALSLSLFRLPSGNYCRCPFFRHIRCC